MEGSVVAMIGLLCTVTVSSNYIHVVKNSSNLVSNSTPLSNRTLSEPIQPAAGFGPWLWPYAVVPYIVDSSFTSEHRQQVALALKEYHDKTCIRFIPKESQHDSWVNFEYNHDPTVCGSANVGMYFGGQYAKFGEQCVNAGVMIHELSHTLGMRHEQTRRDRDKWIDWDDKVCTPHKIDGEILSIGLHKLYDYVSVVHSEVDCYTGCIIPKEAGVTKCGSGGVLSVLDVELLNEVYECMEGCLGYRYVNSKEELKVPIIFGKEANGDNLYSCRAYHQGDIIPGKYHPGWKVCYVGWGGREHKKTGDHIEVFTSPNGASLLWTRTDTLPPTAIPAGRTAARETLFPIQCELTANDGSTVWTPGKYQKSSGAYASYNGREVRCAGGTYRFLTCNNEGN